MLPLSAYVGSGAAAWLLLWLMKAAGWRYDSSKNAAGPELEGALCQRLLLPEGCACFRGSKGIGTLSCW